MDPIMPTTLEFLRQAKWAFTTRRVNIEDIAGISTDIAKAQTGDLILGTVDRIGSHKRIQLNKGRPSQLYPGDLVVLVLAARYAPDQYEGIAKIYPNGSDMLAGGGVVGTMRAANGRMSGPTRIVPIGILTDQQGHAANVSIYCLQRQNATREISVIAAIGTSMNSGKTTAVASLAHGLSRSGFRVAAIKITGTGAFGDFNAFEDAGASFVADFVDVGMASTYQEPLSRVVAGFETLLREATRLNCNVAVVEYADGLFQKETAALLRDKSARSLVDGYLFAAPCATSATAGISELKTIGISPSIVTGLISTSPLAKKELSERAPTRITSRAELCDPAIAGALLAGIRTAGHNRDAQVHAITPDLVA